jgi:hypothetical protein
MLRSVKSNSKVGVISPAWVPLDDRMKSGFQYLESTNILPEPMRRDWPTSMKCLQIRR